MGVAGRALLSLSLSSSLRFSSSLPPSRFPLTRKPLLLQPHRFYVGFRPLSSTATSPPPNAAEQEEDALQPIKHSILLERLRLRHLKESPKPNSEIKQLGRSKGGVDYGDFKKSKKKAVASSFEELGLTEEVMGALGEMGISEPTEIQSIGIPAVIEGKNVVLGSHTGSGKTLAYMLPIVQVKHSFLSIVFKLDGSLEYCVCPSLRLS